MPGWFVNPMFASLSMLRRFRFNPLNVSSLEALTRSSSNTTCRLLFFANGANFSLLEEFFREIFRNSGKICATFRQNLAEFWQISRSPWQCWTAVGWRADLLIRKLRFGIRHFQILFGESINKHRVHTYQPAEGKFLYARSRVVFISRKDVSVVVSLQSDCTKCSNLN